MTRCASTVQLHAHVRLAVQFGLKHCLPHSTNKRCVSLPAWCEHLHSVRHCPYYSGQCSTVLWMTVLYVMKIALYVCMHVYVHTCVHTCPGQDVHTKSSPVGLRLHVTEYIHTYVHCTPELWHVAVLSCPIFPYPLVQFNPVLLCIQKV